MADFTLRPPDDRDLQRLVELERASSLDRGIESSTSEDDIRRQWASPEFDRRRDAVVAVVHNVIAATGRFGKRSDSGQGWGGGYVDKSYRGCGIGTALLRWAIETARARDGVDELWTGADAENAGALGLIESFGFAHVRTWFRMLHRAPGSIAAPDWPAGTELRHFEDPDLVLKHAADAYDGSFIDHFNFHPADRDEWRWWIEHDPTYDPTLIHFAFEGDTLAGMCLTQLDPVTLRGDLGPIGTMRSHRGIGLGRALLRHGTRVLAERGAKEVELGVDSENPNGAVRLYAGNGYEQTHEGRSYRLKL